MVKKIEKFLRLNSFSISSKLKLEIKSSLSIKTADDININRIIVFLKDLNLLYHLINPLKI